MQPAPVPAPEPAAEPVPVGVVEIPAQVLPPARAAEVAEVVEALPQMPASCPAARTVLPGR
jgi:hypothetical protein